MAIFDTILNFIIPAAHAAATTVPVPVGAGPQQGSGLPIMFMLVIFIGFMYFTVWRPQSKRAKDHNQLLGSLTKGDEVMTAGGILGRVAKVTDSYVLLAVSETTEIAVQKSSISGALPKGTIKSI